MAIALTLPGEGSLGAFEAGAVAALIVGIQAIPEPHRASVNVDAITGASSGSLTAVLAAGALLTGEDPVTPLRRAWVSEPSLAALWGRSGSAPLSLERAREVGRDLLGAMLYPDGAAGGGSDSAQKSSVTLEFAVTCLRGFRYAFPRLQSPTPDPERRVAASSYVDWLRHRLAPDDARGLTRAKGLPAGWLAALNASIASASDPLVFPPALLHRSREDFEHYAANGVTNLPVEVEDVEDPRARDELWYSDGGLVDREPVGRCLRLVNGLDKASQAGGARIVVVIRPRADLVPGRDDVAWTGAGDAPRWRTTLARAYRIMTTHNLYEDLRRVEKTNNRIAWADDLVAGLADCVATNPDAEDALRRLAARIATDREAWRKPRELGEPAGEIQDDREERGRHPRGSARDALDLVVRAVAGIEARRRVDVEVVAAPDSARLAGSARGFLAERLRANDFVAGYRQMVDWMENRLSEYDIDDLEVGVTAARKRGSRIPGWTGGVSVSRRTAVRGSAALLRAGLRAGRVGVREIPVRRNPSR